MAICKQQYDPFFILLLAYLSYNIFMNERLTPANHNARYKVGINGWKDKNVGALELI